MPSPERRRDVRVKCRLSLGCRGEWTHVKGTVVDISQTGCRFRVLLAEIGIPAGTRLNQVAVHHLLTDDVVFHFLPEMLGTLVTRRICGRRISLPQDEPHCVEIGGRFDVPLGETETAALGLPLSSPGENSTQAHDPARPHPPRVRSPSRRPSSGGDETWDPAKLGR